MNAEPITRDETDEATVPVTAVVKLRHGVLHQFMRECGSQAEAARRLGVSQNDFSKWVNLKGRPARRMAADRAVALAAKVVECTGHTVDELWPEWLDECFGCITVGERTREFTAGEVRRLMSPVNMDCRALKIEDLRDRLDEALAVLTPGEREVLKRHYGLDGQEPETHAEIGRRRQVTNARIWQMETTAIEKLKRRFDEEDASEPAGD